MPHYRSLTKDQRIELLKYVVQGKLQRSLSDVYSSTSSTVTVKYSKLNHSVKFARSLHQSQRLLYPARSSSLSGRQSNAGLHQF